MEFAERAGQTILYEVIRRGDIARERARIPAQTRDLGFDAPMNVGHEILSRQTRSARWPIQTGREFIGGL